MSNVIYQKTVDLNLQDIIHEIGFRQYLQALIEYAHSYANDKIWSEETRIGWDRIEGALKLAKLTYKKSIE